MIQLTANLSPGLISLIQSETVRLDAVEVGPWFSAGQIQKYRQQLPGWKFYFHHSSLISRLRWVPGTATSLQAYLQYTQTPWISFHYSLLPPGYVWLGTRFGVYLPAPNLDRLNQWFVNEVKKLACHNLPLLIENMPTLATKKYVFDTTAENITEVLTATGAGLLLDLAHARVVASVFNLDVSSYIASLPLEKVRQIHLSGPRTKNGYLYDAHEDLTEIDYELLKWVLTQSKPEVVTLEYVKDREKLREQLVYIKEIIVAT